MSVSFHAGKWCDKEATRSIWSSRCQQERLKASEEEQILPQEDLIDNLRLWNPKDSGELFDRILAHPNKHVPFQVLASICWQTCGESINFDDLLQHVSDLWLDIKKAEKEFETIDESVSWLAKDKKNEQGHVKEEEN